jgi:DNA-binding MarR family transcriptional regulator
MGSTTVTAAAAAAPNLLDHLVGYHLRRASNVFQTDFAATLAGTGIRQALFAILSVVHDNPGINQGLVGKQLGIQRANMVSLINELLDSALVTRAVSPEDRRAYELSLTAAGHETYVTCATAIAAHEDVLLANLSTDERAALIDLLIRIESTDV